MRRQFVLDERSERLLEDLAAERAGKRSFVVREAIRLYAAMESYLEEAEADPGFQRMMERSASDIRSGRVYRQAEVRRRLGRVKRKK